MLANKSQIRGLAAPGRSGSNRLLENLRGTWRPGSVRLRPPRAAPAPPPLCIDTGSQRVCGLFTDARAGLAPIARQHTLAARPERASDAWTRQRSLEQAKAGVRCWWRGMAGTVSGVHRKRQSDYGATRLLMAGARSSADSRHVTLGPAPTTTDSAGLCRFEDVLRAAGRDHDQPKHRAVAGVPGGVRHPSRDEDEGAGADPDLAVAE
jgi:hypothetical protein